MKQEHIIYIQRNTYKRYSTDWGAVRRRWRPPNGGGGEGGSAHAAEVEEGGVWGCRWVEEWGMMDGKALGVAAVPGVPRTGRWAGCEAATAVRRVVLGDMLAKKPASRSARRRTSGGGGGGPGGARLAWCWW